MMKLIRLSVIQILMVISVQAYGQDFYDINTINTIELTFEQSNWDYLLDSLVRDGNENRLIATATINGVKYDSVGVSYKGNSSYKANNKKNPLNIKLDHIINNQEHEGYGTLKLANCYKDPSFIREVLSYEIAREYLPASQANFCKVYINGSYIGPYTSVQDVDKHFLKSHYYSSDNPFFKGELAGGQGPKLATIWGYFGADSSIYSDYYEMESDDGWSNLINFFDVLNNNPASVKDVLNVDRHLWMLAYDILMVNLDAPVNFGHNYYLYEDDAGRFNPIIWDLNENFGVFSKLLDGAPLNLTSMQRMDFFLNETNSNYPIISKIFSTPTFKRMYVAHMKTIIEDFFTNGRYRTRALEIQDIIDADVQNDPNPFYTYTQFKDNIDNAIGGGAGGPGRQQSSPGITELMEGRVTYLNSQPEFQAIQPEINNIAHSPGNIAPNSEIWITTEVTNANSVQLAYRYSQTELFNMIDMLDNGNHNDGNAGDGIYGVSVSVGSTGLYHYFYAENNDAASFSPPRAAYEYYTLEVNGEVVINEFMASNDATATDPDGEYDDWIELYNNSDNDISLSGYFLSDEGDDPTQWTFPDTIIGAYNN